MSSVIEELKNAPDYIGGTGRTEDEIRESENLLGVKFASDYRCYLKEIGLACFDGHELTGICKSARLNVVDVTLLQRKRVAETNFLYVIEETGVDEIVIWQDINGIIYLSSANTVPRKICSSLSEYIAMR